MGAGSFSFLGRQNFASVTGCCSHFQAPAGSESCFSWTQTSTSQLLVIIHLIQGSERPTSCLRYTPKLYPGCTPRQGRSVCYFFPHVAFIWKECVWVEEELWRISADPHLDHQRSGPAGHSIPHPTASLPQVHIQQQSDGLPEGLLILRVKDLPSSSVSSRGVCVLPLEAGYNEQKALRKTIREGSFEYSLFIVKIKYHWKTNVSRCCLERRMN